MTWHNRAEDAIHRGALTNSKRPECFVKGVYSSHVTRGEGCYLYDTDGKKLIDFICGLGTNLLGYANTQINDAVIKQLHKGSVYSLSSTLEVEAAERLKELFPFVGKLRFLKTGSEACSASLRIAMAHTGRTKILSHGYHGHHDHFVSLVPPAIGVPKMAHMEELWNMGQIDETVAAVIVEPIITSVSEDRFAYIKILQDKCRKAGALLIFDEIITGFRFPKYSFSNYSGIQPDILLLGKAIGGGLPLSAVLTRRGIGEKEDWFVSSTFAGDTLALAAMMKTIDLLNNSHRLEDLWDAGERFVASFNSIAPSIVKLNSYPTRGAFEGEDLNKALFFQESFKAGILFGPSFFFNFKHIDVTSIVINSCKDILYRIKNKEVKIEGEMPKKPFAQIQREKT